MNQTEQPGGRKIILIGFNKCGTTSLHQFFEQNGIRSIHWGHNLLAVHIYRNKQQGLPLLTGLDAYMAYSDMEAVVGDGSHPNVLLFAHQEFKLLNEQYPTALFILNTRDREDWIGSRLNHVNGVYAQAFLIKLRLMARNPTITMDQMTRGWRREWDKHHREVELYFHNCDRFLRFNIQADPPIKLSSFLRAHGVAIKDPAIPHDQAVGRVRINWKGAHDQETHPLTGSDSMPDAE